jgi:hypothetical protein
MVESSRLMVALVLLFCFPFGNLAKMMMVAMRIKSTVPVVI